MVVRVREKQCPSDTAEVEPPSHDPLATVPFPSGPPVHLPHDRSENLGRQWGMKEMWLRASVEGKCSAPAAVKCSSGAERKQPYKQERNARELRQVLTRFSRKVQSRAIWNPRDQKPVEYLDFEQKAELALSLHDLPQVGEKVWMKKRRKTEKKSWKLPSHQEQLRPRFRPKLSGPKLKSEVLMRMLAQARAYHRVQLTRVQLVQPE
eukprot:RCo053410